MTNEEWKRIQGLCRQIEVEEDRNVFTLLVSELSQLLGVREHPTGSFAATPQAIGNDHRAEDKLGTVLASGYQRIVDDAVAIMNSDFGSLQMLFPERGKGGELLLLAFRGFNPHAAKFWRWVCADSKSTCGIALRTVERVVAPDIAACDFMADSEDQQVYLQTGIRACQTTPLIAPGSRKVVGMISTHWHTPYQPSPEDFHTLDIVAKQAADLIEAAGRPDDASLSCV